MIDILLNATKLALSEDARKSASAIVDLIRRSPEWERDICVLQAKIEFKHDEHAALLAGLAATKMKNLHFNGQTIEAFQTSYLELTRNAFEYGCGAKGEIEITVDVSSVYVSVITENSRGLELDLDRLVRRQRELIANNPRSLRGRGLLLVEELADTFQSDPPRGVKAVFYRDRVDLDTLDFRGVKIVWVNGGIYNPSITRRLKELVSNALREFNVVLDISRFSTCSSQDESLSIKLDLMAVAAGRIFVVKVGSLYRGNLARNSGLIVVGSWQGMLDVLGIRHLEEELRWAIGNHIGWRDNLRTEW
jgi:anti-sigma regulatory factor (Ser/Thr protein kinase)